MAKHISAGFIVYRQLDENSVEYLLLQASNGGHWGPPKGHLENNETALQAAERETQEEAGLDPSDLHRLDNFQVKISYDANSEPKDVYYYLARIKSFQQSVKISDEHKDLTWCEFDRAFQMIGHPQTQHALRTANEFIKKHQQE